VSPSILREVDSVADFVVEAPATTIEGRRRAARHRLNRRIIDQPFVVLDDLDEDEAELAWRNRRREADNLARLTGCSVELRREGIAMIDHPHQPLGRASFPASDSVAHAALLFVDGLVEAAKPSAAICDHRLVPGERAAACWATVMTDYADRFAKAARDQPEQFRAQVNTLLESFGLIRFVAVGNVSTDDPDIEVAALAARFRARPALAEPALSTAATATAPSLF